MSPASTAPAATAEAPARPVDRPVIAMRKVSKHYRGGGGIEDVTLEVRPGEVFGVLGPNGAGKTTTIRLLVDLIRLDRGELSIFGLDPRTGGVAVRRRIGYLPGDLALYEKMSARDLLLHFAHLRGCPSRAAIEALAEQLALDLDTPIAALSKGNKQKVGLLQAVMGEPELLVLDEPTTGLDPLVQHQVHELLRSAAESGRTVFLSSHFLSQVQQVADRVAMIRAGRVVAVGDSAITGEGGRRRWNAVAATANRWSAGACSGGRSPSSAQRYWPGSAGSASTALRCWRCSRPSTETAASPSCCRATRRRFAPCSPSPTSRPGPATCVGRSSPSWGRSSSSFSPSSGVPT